MKINFSELLASERIRPLWGRSFTQESASDELERLLRANSPQGDEPGATSPPGARSQTVGHEVGDVQAAAAGPRAASDSAAGQASAAAQPSLGQTPLSFDAAAGGGSGSQLRGDKRSAQDADLTVTPPDLAELPIRPPHEIFADLERAVQGDLGTRATMVRNFIEALRVRVHAVDPTADAALYHPMRHAAGGTLFELLHRMEDTLSGLRRVAAGR